MLLEILKSKIHRATVTDGNVDYEGSITLDIDLMKASGLVENELVHIWDVTNGNRLSTYVMTPAPAGSGTVCINGSAALKIHTGDIVIISSFAHMTPEEASKHKPTKVLVNEKNEVTQIKS
jgi:aspartate 1-decarboxylase